MEFAQFDEETVEELRYLLNESCAESTGPYGDMEV